MQVKSWRARLVLVSGAVLLLASAQATAGATAEAGATTSDTAARAASDEAFSCTRWAAPGGGSWDGSTGSREDPFGGLTELALALQPGQTGCIEPGTTLIVVGEGTIGVRPPAQANTPKTIRSGPGGRATIEGSVTVNDHDFVLRDLTFRQRPAISQSLVFLYGARTQLLDSDLSNALNICLIIGRGRSTVGAQDQIAADGAIVERNRIHHCARGRGEDPGSGWHGVHVQEGDGIKFRHNVVYENEYRGLQAYPNPKNLEVAYNVFDRNGSNINIGHLDAANITEGMHVHHNVVTNARLSPAPGKNPSQIYGNMPDDPDDRGNRVEQNCLFYEDPALHADPAKHLSAGWAVTGRYGYARTGNLFADPGYVDRAAGDYRMRPSGPCAAMGPRSDAARSGSVPADFDGNGTTDPAVFRPSNDRWYLTGRPAVAWGANGDIPVPGDYDGNGTTDPAVFRPSNDRWYLTGGTTVAFGTNGDIPVPGDYDGNGTTDPAVFRPSNGRWYLTGRPAVAWGANGDIPVPGDYDGNGTTDPAVFRPSNGRWYLTGGTTVAFGTNGDIPVPGDYDGNGTTDPAVFRPSNGRWYLTGGSTVAFGTNGDIPVPGDYDGNGTTDPAVFRPSNGRWYLTGGSTVAFGTNGDVPAVVGPGAYLAAFGTSLLLHQPVTDNYKACFNADPSVVERRTWFPVRAITARGQVFSSTGASLVPAADGLLLQGPGGPALLQATATPPSTAAINGSFRAEPSQFGYLGIVTSRAALQANPLQVDFTLTRGGSVLGTVRAHYVYEPAIAAVPAGHLEHNGPAGRWVVGGAPSPFNWQVDPGQSC